MLANERQVGGDHYKGVAYQYWDYADDLRLPYLVGHAGKYIARWRTHEDGEQNLHKAIHFMDKIMEVKPNLLPVINRASIFWRYVIANNTSMRDARVLWHLQEGEWAEAKAGIEELLAQTASDDRRDQN